MYCKFEELKLINELKKVLIVAKCIVNIIATILFEEGSRY